MKHKQGMAQIKESLDSVQLQLVFLKKEKVEKKKRMKTLASSNVPERQTQMYPKWEARRTTTMGKFFV